MTREEKIAFNWEAWRKHQERVNAGKGTPPPKIPDPKAMANIQAQQRQCRGCGQEGLGGL